MIKKCIKTVTSGASEIFPFFASREYYAPSVTPALTPRSGKHSKLSIYYDLNTMFNKRLRIRRRGAGGSHS